MDYSAIFTKSKIKSQILQDEDVGTLSAKAIELISACSALLVDDLVRGNKTTTSRKRPRSSLLASASLPDRQNSGPVDLAQVTAQVNRREEYDIFRGAVGDVTEEKAPKYDATRVSREKRRGWKAAADKRKKTQVASGKSEVKLPSDLKAGDDVALQSAIAEARGATASYNNDIVEDDEDYD